MPIICKNCGQKFKGNFCNTCGQSAHTHGLSLAYFWHEIQHGIFHVDKGILFTTKALFTRPGNAIKDYIAGKRVSHSKPFAYVFILSSLYAVLAHFFKQEILLQGLTNEMGDNILIKSQDAAEATKVKLFVQSIYGVLFWMKDHYAYTNLLSLPVFTLASFWAFRKNGYNYFEHLVLNTYIAGQRTVLFLILMPLDYFVTNQRALDTIDDVKTMITIGLIYWTFNQFFSANKWFVNLRKTIVSFIYLMVFTLIIIILVFVVLAILRLGF